jgi:hypothetical protein
MVKVIAVAALLSGVSTMVAIPASDTSLAPRLSFKADRIEIQADAGVRNYLSPLVDGRPVAFCLDGAGQCGKDAADAFCRGNGFGEAITFQRDGVQSDPDKLYFRQIKCRHPQVFGVEQDVIIEFAGATVTSNAAAKSDRL